MTHQKWCIVQLIRMKSEKFQFNKVDKSLFGDLENPDKQILGNRNFEFSLEVF